MTREFKYIHGTLKFIDCEIWTTNIKFQKYLQIKYKREKKSYLENIETEVGQ